MSGFGLTGAIRDASPVRFCCWEWHSNGRLHGFYIVGLLLFVVFIVLAAATQEERTNSSKPAVPEETVLSEVPALLFPPEGALLEPEKTVIFGWKLVRGADHGYRLEVQSESGEELLSVNLPQMLGTFVVPMDKLAQHRKLRWRSLPINSVGAPTSILDWTTFEINHSKTP